MNRTAVQVGALLCAVLLCALLLAGAAGRQERQPGQGRRSRRAAPRRW